MKRCPNCGYERQLKDDEYKIIPTTECPKCGIIYDRWTSTKKIGDKSKERENNTPQIKASKYSKNKSLTNAALLIFSVLIVITLIISLYSKWSVPNKAQQSKKTDQLTHAGSISADLAINGTQTSTITPANQSASAVLDVPSQSVPQDLPSLYKTVAPSVVLISTDKSRGTGFFINNGYVVTNNHVIAGATQIKIKTSDNKEYVVRQIIAKDVTNDLAILSGTESQGEIRSLVISPTTPEVGEKIFVVSNPLGHYEKSLSEGLIAGIRESSSLRLFQFTAPISSGSSGGPVFNMRGEVICIVRSVVAPGGALSQNLNLCIPGEKVMALLKGEISPPTQITTRKVYCALLDNGAVVITETPQTVSSYTLISNPDGSLDKATYEKWVFEKIGGNPFILDPTAAAQSSIDRDREEIFKQSFPYKNQGQGMSVGEQKFLNDRINQLYSERYNRALAWKNRATMRYNYMLDVFYRYAGRV